MRTLGQALLALAFAAQFVPRADAQIHYSSGQNVVPVYEGWERNADGSYNMVFGYMNRNYDEQVDIPQGTANMFEPGTPDRGQPTHFYPRRQEFVFKVKIPADWGDKDLVWTLSSRGKVEKAYGSLLPIWELGSLVYLENRRGAAFLTYPEEPNTPPSIEVVGSSARTVAPGQPLTMSVQVTDDGYPTPHTRAGRTMSASRERGRDAQGNGLKMQSPISQAVVKLDPGVRLGVTWVLYRGPAEGVAFDPVRVPVTQTGSVTADGPPGSLKGTAPATITLSEPGQYTFRAYADDGVFTTPADVNVIVTARAR